MINEDEIEFLPEIEGEAELGQRTIPIEDTGLSEVDREPENPDPENPGPSPVNYPQFFVDLFTEVYEIEKGFQDAQEIFTQILLRGVQVNPQSVYDLVNLTTTRLTKICVVKRLTNCLGLIDEYDRILEKELEVIYGKNKPYTPPAPVQSFINGENNGRGK